REGKLKKVYWPSSIAVFGPTTPKDSTPQQTVTEPTTVYGISKLAGEGWCQYYHKRYGVDVRNIRYPGLIGWKSAPGGGTTDYAVEIYHKAIEDGRYTSFIAENTAMPMLYMEDAIAATIRLMQAPAEALSVHTSYNLGGMSFTPKQLAGAIRREIPEFEISYAPDFRQAIAESWPASIDDSVARKDWGLSYRYDIHSMTREMLENLRVKSV
ncbi:MAG: NAD-dependent epimerase/dehydratase family protein, partial [Leadbetterella sp.]|nr:NAD-dependent epimerase/dehydratase family protein [Leadbetterella sp.]